MILCSKVQTGGGGTGTFWAHDSWNLSSPPDIVVFAKKLMVAGYFYAEHLQMKEVGVIFLVICRVHLCLLFFIFSWPAKPLVTLSNLIRDNCKPFS